MAEYECSALACRTVKAHCGRRHPGISAPSRCHSGPRVWILHQSGAGPPIKVYCSKVQHLQLLLALSCLQCGPVIALLYRQRKARAAPDLYCLLTALAGEGRANGPGRRGQLVTQPQKRPRTDWALGLSVAYDAELLEVRLLLSSALHTLRTAHKIKYAMQGSQSALV